MEPPPTFPIRRHHRLGPLRSAAVVVIAAASAAGLAVAALRRRRPRQHPADEAERTQAPPTGAGDRQRDALAATTSALGATWAAVAWLRRPAAGRRHPAPFAVVDTETTGLDTALDRVIEVAVVHADGVGDCGPTFTWRIRPGDGRHGAEHIHHISQADLADAPRFSEVAEAIAEALEGRTLVAHNARFDTGFLAREFARAGRRLPQALARPLCTLDLAARLGMAPLRLAEVARAVGSPPPATAHRAADDAVATARLLGPLLNRAGIARAEEIPLVEGLATIAAPVCPRAVSPAGR
ncbi:MAG: 3'-5' exonuclease [Microthrixaceae bacterium]